MYQTSRSSLSRTCVPTFVTMVLAGCFLPVASAQQVDHTGFSTPNIVRNISSRNERLELTTNSSRILTLDKRIPRFQVNNPELLGVTALSATQIQISAKEPGVTQVNLWDEDKQIHTVDVIIYGDLRELEFAIKTQFPNSSISVRRYSQSLVMTGFVDNPDHVSRIMRLAEDYAPKVIDNLSVGGVQQVLLKVKIYEVSRTKLERLGVDWAALSSSGDFVASSISGILQAATVNTATTLQNISTSGGQTLQFGVIDDGTGLISFLEALEENNLAKILAEPKIVSVSGRPAQFLEGGETPILVPQGLGTTTIEYRPFGTQVDFLPIVLGNGRIRLEVRPEVSAIAPDLAVQLQGNQIPGFRVRRADTAVEMQAGQTFALAGLIQQQIQANERGLPWIADIPGIGIPFRKIEQEVNEVELLFLVTPEFVDAMDPHEVPQCLPGMGTKMPTRNELFIGGKLEVPNYCSPCGQANSQYCGPCCEGGLSGNCGGNCSGSYGGAALPHAGSYHEGGVMQELPAPPGYAPVPTPAEARPMPSGAGIDGHMFDEGYESVTPISQPKHGELTLPPRPGAESMPTSTQNGSARGPVLMPRTARRAAPMPARHTPNYVRSPQRTTPPAVRPLPPRGAMIGPVGYDVE